MGMKPCEEYVRFMHVDDDKEGTWWHVTVRKEGASVANSSVVERRGLLKCIIV
jgi:hypothetical protein